MIGGKASTNIVSRRSGIGRNRAYPVPLPCSVPALPLAQQHKVLSLTRLQYRLLRVLTRQVLTSVSHLCHLTPITTLLALLLVPLRHGPARTRSKQLSKCAITRRLLLARTPRMSALAHRTSRIARRRRSIQQDHDQVRHAGPRRIRQRHILSLPRPMRTLPTLRLYAGLSRPFPSRE